MIFFSYEMNRTARRTGCSIILNRLVVYSIMSDRETTLIPCYFGPIQPAIHKARPNDACPLMLLVRIMAVSILQFAIVS
jgi:hypothetical protein